MLTDRSPEICALISKSNQYAPSAVNLLKIWPCQYDHDKISMNQVNVKTLEAVAGTLKKGGESSSGLGPEGYTLVLDYLKQALNHYSCALELNIQGSTFFELNKMHIELAVEIVEQNVPSNTLPKELKRIQEGVEKNSKISDLTLCGEVIVQSEKLSGNHKVV